MGNSLCCTQNSNSLHLNGGDDRFEDVIPIHQRKRYSNLRENMTPEPLRENTLDLGIELKKSRHKPN